MKSAELTPTAQKIDKLIKRIDEGDIKIPAFQRGFVWKQEQIIDLLESLTSEYPIGSVLLWETNEKLNSTRNIAGYNIPDRGDSYPVNYVLDGQQRIASIYGVFSQAITQEMDTLKYNPNPDIFEIYYNFSEERFIDKAGLTDIPDNEIIHLRHLLNVTTLIPALNTLEKKYHAKAQDLASQFLNYEVPVVTISNRNREDVGIIFERINNTGTKLSALDLMTAWTWTDDFHLLEECNSLCDELSDKGFGELKHNTLLQIIAAVIKNSTITSNILSLTGSEVRDNWTRIKSAIFKGVDFLSTDLKCQHLDFLPYTQQLIPIIKFYDLIKSPSSDQIKVLRQYFWKTSFSNRYSTGQTSSKMDSDIENLVKLSNNELNAFDEYRYTVNQTILKNTVFSKANAITRAILLLMAQHNPVDLVKNQKIDITKSLSNYNRKEYHHIFPHAYLKKREFSHDSIFCVLNFCFLPSSSNKQISDKKPSEYFFNLIPTQDFNKILESNLIPITKQLYKDDDYESFLSARASAILSTVDKFVS